jgi:hypothetical protein
VSDRESATPVAPLSVEADLALSIDGGEATVESAGRRLVVRFESVPDAMRAFRGRPGGPEDGLPELLRATDLTAEVRVRDRIVAVVGPDARPGTLSRLLGVAPVEVRAGGLLGAVGVEAGTRLRTG